MKGSTDDQCGQSVCGRCCLRARISITLYGGKAVAGEGVQGMEKIQERIMNITDKLENNCVIGAIRQGMILMIPLLVVGYMSAMLINLPIPRISAIFVQSFLGRMSQSIFGECLCQCE